MADPYWFVVVVLPSQVFENRKGASKRAIVVFCTTENPIHFNIFEGGLIIGFLSWLNEPITGGGGGGAGGGLRGWGGGV